MQRLQDVYVSIDKDRDRQTGSAKSHCWVNNRNGWVTLTMATPPPNQYRIALELQVQQAKWLAVALMDCADQEVA
jgi:hypothetical protein